MGGANSAQDQPTPYRHPAYNPATKGLVPLWLDTTHGRGTADISVSVEEGATEDKDGVVRQFSGLVASTRRKASPAERARWLAESMVPSPPLTRPKSKLRQDTLKRYGSHSDQDLVLVMLEVAHELEEPLFVQLDDAAVRSDMRSSTELAEYRRKLLNARSKRYASSVSKAAVELRELGIQDIVVGQDSPYIKARVKKSQLNDIAQLEQITSIEPPPRIAPAWLMTNEDVRRVTQIKQFIDAGYAGDRVKYNGVSSYEITFAMLEPGAPLQAHPGFKDGSGSKVRLRDVWSCSGYACGPWGSWTGSHATTVAGVLMGDIMQNQDPAWPSTILETNLIRRSGAAREAEGYSIAGMGFNYNDPNDVDLEDQDFVQALDLVPALPRFIPVMNMSAGDETMTNRDGDTIMDKAVNRLFEAGTLPILAAGNERQDAPNAPTTIIPASAIGAFTVGAYGEADTEDVELLAAPPASYTSRGGVNGRSIVDIAAPGTATYFYSTSGGYTGTSSSTAATGTSIATPVVTGTAIDFIDWYKNNLSDAIDDPGRLFSALLLMGDRGSESGGKRTTTWDTLLGAGRLHARMFDSAGLDGPWGASFGTTCVLDGHIQNYWITGVPSDADAFMFVAFWYDARHGLWGRVDDIALALYVDGVKVKTADTADNKERIYYSDPHGDMFVEIYGKDITSSSSGCGASGMRINYAWYYEDSDRESSEGLDDIQKM